MDPAVVYRSLRGLFCIYKPAGQTTGQVIFALKTKILKGLNEIAERSIETPRQKVVYHPENIGTNLPVATTVPDLAHHPLVIGPRYLFDDLYVNRTDNLGSNSSGVLVMSINCEDSLLTRLVLSRQMRVYHAKGELGIATLNFTPTGKVMAKSSFRHVNRNKMDKVLAAIQSGHQKYMFQVSGVSIQSQEAYELASKGLIRPRVGRSSSPLIYNIKCIDFNPPYFTLEIHCINEFCKYLTKLVHEIGLELKTNAVCTQLRRIRYGHFTLDHALTKNQWSVLEVGYNLRQCRQLLTRDKLYLGGNIKDIEQEEEEALLRLAEQQHPMLTSGGPDDGDFGPTGDITDVTDTNVTDTKT